MQTYVGLRLYLSATVVISFSLLQSLCDCALLQVRRLVSDIQSLNPSTVMCFLGFPSSRSSLRDGLVMPSLTKIEGLFVHSMDYYTTF